MTHSTRSTGRYKRAKDNEALDIQILQLMANGIKMKQIENTVCRSGSTVENRLHSMRIKFEAINTAHLIAIAMRKGLIW